MPFSENITVLFRKKTTSGGNIPSNAKLGEPFVNVYNGILYFSGKTGGDFVPAPGQPGVFEVGSKVSELKITNSLNLNNLFVVSADTGIISVYGGLSGSSLVGKFLSGTSQGFVVANISDLSISGGTGSVTITPGSNIFVGGTPSNPIIGVVDSPFFNDLSSSGNTSLQTLSALTIFSASTNLYDIFQTIGSISSINIKPGSNISTGGTPTEPIINVVSSPHFDNIYSSGITPGQVVFVALNGLLTGKTGFEYDGIDNLTVPNISIIPNGYLHVGSGTPIFNYNSTADTSSTSLGSGILIQDGSGVQGTNVFFDIRGISTGATNRSFCTNLEDIRIRESGSTSSPNGKYVLASEDILDGGIF